jgi:hypothetical protein
MGFMRRCRMIFIPTITAVGSLVPQKREVKKNQDRDQREQRSRPTEHALFFPSA